MLTFQKILFYSSWFFPSILFPKALNKPDSVTYSISMATIYLCNTPACLNQDEWLNTLLGFAPGRVYPTNSLLNLCVSSYLTVSPLLRLCFQLRQTGRLFCKLVLSRAEGKESKKSSLCGTFHGLTPPLIDYSSKVPYSSGVRTFL